jgi:hypothetical protein
VESALAMTEAAYLGPRQQARTGRSGDGASVSAVIADAGGRRCKVDTEVRVEARGDGGGGRLHPIYDR